MRMLNNLSPDQKAKLMGAVSGGQSSFSTANDLSKTKQIDSIAGKKPLEKAPPIEAEIKESVLEVGSSIIVYFKNDENLNIDEYEYTPDYPQQMFKLDQRGVIEIPGIGRIALAGLTEENAAARINLEPLLQQYVIKVLKLPIQQFGVIELEPFGYDLFKEIPDQMSPYSSMPVPADYIVGPGDQVHIQLLGKENQEFLLEISRDSTLALPGIGVFPVSGLNFDELKRDIKKRIKKQFIGVDAFITLGELRSIRVFVMGEVKRPGAYSVSGLATMTNALMFGEGINDIGSLRHIELKRSGKSVGKLDLYKLLLSGDTSGDQRLRPGDVIHVPPIKSSVSISGEVRRPAIYEMNKEKSVSDMIKLAGGLLPTARQGNVKIVRVEGAEKKLIDINLMDKSLNKFTVKSGDIISVDSVLDRQENIVYLKGEVIKPGEFQWTPALKLIDVIPSKRLLKANADAEYILIKRYTPPTYNLQILTSSLNQVLLNPASKENIPLKPRDEVVVFSLSDKRLLQIEPVVKQLIAQSDSTQPSQIVRINGMVRGPGTYPLHKKMRLSDLVMAGGRLTESAFTLDAELTRFIVKPGKARETTLLKVNLRDAMLGDGDANLLLQPYDLLNIKEIPSWQEEDHVELVGQILFPGNYAIQRGETLKDLLIRAGGVTEFAYPQGAVFIREDLKAREQKRLDEMSANLESELASISLERSGDPTKIQSVGTANQLLTKLKGAEAAGRLVIDLEKIIDSAESDTKYPILLRGGDKLYIPSKMQEVSVIGQVFHPTSHLFNDDLSVDEYIDLSGGMTRTADEGSVYVVRANGAVQSTDTSWAEDELILLPGDTVVVPLDADRISTLKLWTDLSQIVYQLGLSAAAWNTVGLFSQ